MQTPKKTSSSSSRRSVPKSASAYSIRVTGPNGKVVASLKVPAEAPAKGGEGVAKQLLSAIRKIQTRERRKTRDKEADEILRRVEAWAGSRDQARSWYRGQGISALGDQTAEAMVRTGQADLVRRYLDSIAVGGYA